MKLQVQAAPPKVRRCTRCGNSEVSTMAELRALVSTDNNEFSSDLAEWLSPPQRPKRPISKRFRSGMRNSIAFGVVWLIIFSAACFALSGSAPPLILSMIAVGIAITVGVTNWRSESRLATKENNFLMAAHWERYRAYLHRRRVWARLRYCAKCGLVVDPVTLRSASLYEVHELANSRVKGVTLK